MTPSTEKNPKYQKTLTPFLAETFRYNYIMLVSVLVEKRLNFSNPKSDFK